MNLPLSQPGTLRMSGADFDGAKNGLKTCTSRYGDKTQDYDVGSVVCAINNDDNSTMNLVIDGIVVKLLRDVTTEEAFAIGQYSRDAHYDDFYEVYHNKIGRAVDGNTTLTLIYFHTLWP